MFYPNPTIVNKVGPQSDPERFFNVLDHGPKDIKQICIGLMFTPWSKPRVYSSRLLDMLSCFYLRCVVVLCI